MKVYLKKSIAAKIAKYSGRKSFLHLLMMSFLKVQSKSFSKRHPVTFFLWFRAFTKSLFVSLFSLYKEKETQIKKQLHRDVFGSTEIQTVSSVVEPICISNTKNLFKSLKKIKTIKLVLSKILWSKYSFKAFFVGAQKLITVLRSPHTDKKARDQFYRKNFTAMGLYPKFFSKQYIYLYKNLFKRNKFLWSQFERFN